LTFTRREFLQQGGAAAMALALHQSRSQKPVPKFRTQLNVGSLPQFVDPLPIPEIAKANGTRPSPIEPRIGIPYYRVAMQQFESKVHRDLKPTRQWGFTASSAAATSPGPTFETRGGQGLFVEWANELPEAHFLPIDHSIHGAESDKPPVRTVIHLHGGKTPSESDGYPEKWYAPGKSAVFHYPNRQDAAMLWYHDHALGINRLNVFAGLLGAFIVRDEVEDGLNLPRGKYEVPLMLYDRVFDLESQLNYPVSGNPEKAWTPEVFGDAILVNGKLCPYLDVEPRKYRFRVLNGSNARFFHLSLPASQGFHQIGTDQGLLAVPVQLDRVSLAPAERADLVVDFAGLGGTNLVLKNDFATTVMQFRVTQSGSHDSSALPQTLRPVPKIGESTAIKTRKLSLVEVDDLKGRPFTMLLNNTHWNGPVTENPVLDSTEIWELINTTDDAHPIHLHLVRFQILDRRSFDVAAYWMQNGELKYTGSAIPAELSEAGWKDTVRADPGMITRIITKFEGFPGRYVWHCHILEHEDNEMMRPFDVVRQ
jgi:spore coat protein A, manganese oxidase